MKNLLKKLASNKIVDRAFHTAWQAGFGALLAALTSTHGDVRAAVIIGGAAAAAAIKTAVLQQLAPVPAVTAADMVEVSAPVAAPAPVVEAPAPVVTPAP